MTEFSTETYGDNALSRNSPMPGKPETLTDQELDFRAELTFEELVSSQHVSLMMEVDSLFGTWPGQDDDGFEESVRSLRHLEMTGKGDG
jgi:hypothetical protein